jgi:hypothetical protein
MSVYRAAKYGTDSHGHKNRSLTYPNCIAHLLPFPDIFDYYSITLYKVPTLVVHTWSTRFISRWMNNVACVRQSDGGVRAGFEGEVIGPQADAQHGMNTFVTRAGGAQADVVGGSPLILPLR